MIGSGGCSYGIDNETSMMMMATPEEFDSGSIITNQGVCHDIKIASHHSSSIRKQRSDQNLLKMYAIKLGLNDRGCYLSCALAALAFVFLVIIITLAACWPGNS